MSCSFYYFTKI